MFWCLDFIIPLCFVYRRLEDSDKHNRELIATSSKKEETILGLQVDV